MAEPAYRYRDPLEVLIREEERTCKGCTHTIRTIFTGRGIHQVFETCAKRRRHGTRCKHYQETT